MRCQKMPCQKMRCQMSSCQISHPRHLQRPSQLSLARLKSSCLSQRLASMLKHCFCPKITRSGAGASLCCNLDVSSATARREAYTSTSNMASPWRKWAEEVHSSRQYDFHLQVLARLVDLRVSCRSGSTLEFPRCSSTPGCGSCSVMRPAMAACRSFSRCTI